MFRLLTLVVCLVAGCTLHEPPTPQPGPPGPDDLSTWGTPELVPEPPRPRLEALVAPPPKPGPAEKVYDYVPGGVYTVPVALGAPLDIQFLPGEEVHNAVDSDRRPLVEGQDAGQRTCQRWCLDQGKSGTGATKRGHLFVTVTEAGLKNGLTITTTLGTYAITLESVKASPIRYLRWTHAPAPVAVSDHEPLAVGPVPDTTQASQWRVGYRIEALGSPPDWTPLGAWDDGHKLYILLPKTALYGTSPLMRRLGPYGPAAVNGRQYQTVLIVDELAAVLELRVGTDDTGEVVRITRGTLRIIDCPEDAECPIFPHASQRSAS